MGIKAKVKPKRLKKARYAIRNVSKKDLSNIIKEFDKLPYKSYERRRPKHELTNSHFYLARQLAKCMTRAHVLNLHVYPLRTEMTSTKQIPTSQVCSTDKSKLKELLVDETLLQIFSTNEDESKGTIVDKCSMDEDESECVRKNINKQKDSKNEAEYEESSGTDEVPSYFNIFECVRNILNRTDMTYDQE